MGIPDIDIDIRDISIPEVRDWMVDPPMAIPPSAPVTTQIGVPIVDMPGCVEAHESNNKSKSVGIDDENGMVTYCDSGMPNFNPLDYKPDQLDFDYKPSIPPVGSPDSPEVPPAPELPPPPVVTAVADCPTASQNAKEPIGTYVQGYRKKVTEYKLVGNECIQITEAVGIPQQIIAGLPGAGQVSSVGGIAVIATTSALLAKPLADLLLKVVKPTVKKVIKKIAAIRGKSLPILSLKERRDLQRERTKAIRVLKSALKPKG
jgi:hypothetical protein